MANVGNRAPDAELPLEVAAERLGLPLKEMRKRAQRGKQFKGVKRGEQWFVRLRDVERAEQFRAPAPEAPSPPPIQVVAPAASESALVLELRDQVRFLRQLIATRDEEVRRRDAIIAGLVQRIPELGPGRTGEPSTAREPQRATQTPVGDLRASSEIPLTPEPVSPTPASVPGIPMPAAAPAGGTTIEPASARRPWWRLWS
jgi:hypothetical protein